MHNTNEKRRIGLFLLILGALVLLAWGSSIARSRPLGMLDFRAIYYVTSGLIHHQDPYNQAALRAYYQASGGIHPEDPAWLIYTLTLVNYLPSTYPIIAPFALFSWQTAQWLWLAISTISFLAGAFVIWRLIRGRIPLFGGLLIGFLLANSLILLGGGNAACLVVGLCTVAVWCLLQQRLAALAVLCLAVSLALKPHDAGFLWLYFFLAGGVFRRRALQSLVLVVVIAAIGIIWIHQIVPQWLPELRTVMATYDAPGGANYPGFHGVSGSAFRAYDLPTSPGMVCDLRTIVAVFGEDPHFYTPVTWLICLPLLAIWAVVTLRLPSSPRNTIVALAAIVPLSLLPVYHRTTDAKLLLLVIPACALLWAQNHHLRWPAALLTTAAIILTGDIPLTLIGMSIGPVNWAHASLGHRIALAVITRPVPLILLVLGVFYLYVYIRQLQLRPSTASAGGPEVVPEQVGA